MVYQPIERQVWDTQISLGARLDRAIMGAIEAAGAVGITCQDIELKTERSHQAVSANLRRLVERGLVEASGNYGLTHARRRAIKWRLKSAEAGHLDPLPHEGGPNRDRSLAGDAPSRGQFPVPAPSGRAQVAT